MPDPSLTPLPTIKEWKKIVAPFTKPSASRASWQVFNSIGGYLALWVLMFFTVSLSFWLTVGIALIAGALLVRVFIIFHDCGHGSFYRSRRANDVVGFISGVLTFTPYRHWRWEHSVHHGAAQDLDRRGTGDVWTMTVEEYLSASFWKRTAYRTMRNPLVLFLIAPLYLFVVRERFWTSGANQRQKRSVLFTNLGILLVAVLGSLVFGFQTYAILQLCAIGVSSTVGVWLFYVQHQYEGVYWEREEDWDYTSAALEGSSFYKLPRVLQWFSGNIGFHHIHHLSSRIPNYHLERCHDSHEIFRSIEPLTFWAGFKSLSFRLWDEEERKLVGFRAIRGVPRGEVA